MSSKQILIEQLNQLNSAEMTQLYDVYGLTGPDDQKKKALYHNMFEDFKKQQRLDDLMAYYLVQAALKDKRGARAESSHAMMNDFPQEVLDILKDDQQVKQENLALAQQQLQQLSNAIRTYDKEAAKLYKVLAQKVTEQIEADSEELKLESEIADIQAQQTGASIPAAQVVPAAQQTNQQTDINAPAAPKLIEPFVVPTENKISDTIPKFDNNTIYSKTAPKLAPTAARSKQKEEELDALRGKLTVLRKGTEKRDEDIQTLTLGLLTINQGRNTLVIKYQAIQSGHPSLSSFAAPTSPFDAANNLMKLIGAVQQAQQQRNKEILAEAFALSKQMRGLIDDKLEQHSYEIKA